MPHTVELAPSILSANFANLAAHARQALEGGGTLLHVDIMDGHFVPVLMRVGSGNLSRQLRTRPCVAQSNRIQEVRAVAAMARKLAVLPHRLIGA